MSNNSKDLFHSGVRYSQAPDTAVCQLRHPLKPLVFASKTAFGRIDIKKAWQTALRTAGITNFRAHDMRHTLATFAAGQGASNLELATAMGHRTLQMLQRYTHRRR